MSRSDREQGRLARRAVLDRDSYGGSDADEYLPFSFNAAHTRWGVGPEALAAALRALGAQRYEDLPATARRAVKPATWWMRRRRLDDLISIEPVSDLPPPVPRALGELPCFCGSGRKRRKCHPEVP